MSSQLLLTLKMRCISDDTGEFGQKLDKVARDACKQRWKQIREKAWGLEMQTAQPQSDDWLTRRTAQHEVQVQVVDGTFDADAESTWTESLEEPVPWCIAHGTKESFLRGRCRAVAMYQKLCRHPAGAFQSLCGTGYAISDISCSLPDRHCYVIKAGRVYVGPIVVWRYPAMLPEDVQLWHAIALPPGTICAPDNVIICSRIGQGVLSLSGGDYDGDFICFTTDEALVDLLEGTSDCSDTPHVAALRGQIRADLAGESIITPLAGSHIEAYLRHVTTVPTPNLRGRCVAMAERAQTRLFDAVTQEDIGSSINLVSALAEVGYAAFDAPKKFSSDTVQRKCREVCREYGLQVREERASIVAKGALGPVASDVTTKTAVLKFKIEQSAVGIQLGRVWLSKPHAKLGAAAGKRVRKEWLKHSSHALPSFERTAMREPITEMAKLIAHRLGGINKAKAFVVEGRLDDLLVKLNAAGGQAMTKVSSLVRSQLI